MSQLNHLFLNATSLTFLLLISSFCSLAQINWEESIDIAPNDFGNNMPRVVIDAEGDPVVMWAEYGDVHIARWEGGGFTDPMQLNPEETSIATATWMGPSIASYGDTIYVVYKETPENLPTSHLWCRKSTDGGVSFSNPVQVENIGDSLSRFAEVTTDDLGNPIVAFMQFSEDFLDHTWSVCRSANFGEDFEDQVTASGWSSGTTEACDCCPGTLVSSENTLALLYRDNNSNIRDTWAGISTDGGSSFTAGMNVDQNNWIIQACPSSGPDGFIIGDTLYSTFMNGASGTSRVYFSKASLSSITGTGADLITGEIEDLNHQNYPRMDEYNGQVAIVWKQRVGWQNQLAFHYSENVTQGIGDSFEILAEDGVYNADVALYDNKIYVVWQASSGTVKFMRGTIDPSSVPSKDDLNALRAFPNPSDGYWIISGNMHSMQINFELMDSRGVQTATYSFNSSGNTFTKSIDNSQLASGLYFLRISDGFNQRTLKLVKK